MAYAYSGLQCIDAGGLAGQRRVWSYSSADARTAIQGAAYFTDSGTTGKAKMTVGDHVIVTVSGTGATSIHSVTTVTSTGATISTSVFT